MSVSVDELLGRPRPGSRRSYLAGETPPETAALASLPSARDTSSPGPQGGGASSAPYSTASWSPLQPGFPGTKDMLVVMRAQVLKDFLDPRVIFAAQKIVHDGNAQGGNRVQEASAIFHWIVAHIDYRRDPTSTDMARDPILVLSEVDKNGFSAGDCNNQATLFATLGHAIRLPIVFCVVGDSLDSFRHVYPCLDLRPGAIGTDDDPQEIPTDDQDLLALDTASYPRTPEIGRNSDAATRWLVPALKGV